VGLPGVPARIVVGHVRIVDKIAENPARNLEGLMGFR
jgi:hypothetical protein